LVADFGFFANTPKVLRWREALLNRQSVIEAVLPTYPQLLHKFLLKRDSQLTQIIQVGARGADESHD